MMLESTERSMKQIQSAISTMLVGLDYETVNNRLTAVIEEFGNKFRAAIAGAQLIGQISDSALQSIERLNASTLAFFSCIPRTEMNESIMKAFANLDYGKCVNIADKALMNRNIVAPDIFFFKNAALADAIREELHCPYGFKTALRELNKSTAITISDNTDIFYETESRGFWSTSSGSDILLSSREMNGISSVMYAFNDLGEELFTECELMDLMDFLYNTPSFAMEHRTAQKIHNLITMLMDSNNSVYKHGFDRDVYYHSRPYDKGSSPYLCEEMLRAPIGVSGAGRYNYTGQSHYYFADTIKGSEAEIRKHNKDKEIMTVALRPVKSIVLLDLSGKMRRATTFFKYIRFRANPDNGKVPREYRIPCFVADCCKKVGFDGIKYYGGEGYSNYVTWIGDYFEISRCE